MKQDAFIVAYMRRNHPRAPYELRDTPMGWQLRSRHPDTGKLVSIDIRAERVFPGDEHRAAREWAKEPYLPNWELWQVVERPHRFIAGIHVYAQLVFAIEVQPNILETDPGPLDARVP